MKIVVPAAEGVRAAQTSRTVSGMLSGRHGGESVPDFLGAVAMQEKVVHVFASRARGAAGRGSQIVSEAPLICVDTTAEQKPKHVD